MECCVRGRLHRQLWRATQWPVCYAAQSPERAETSDARGDAATSFATFLGREESRSGDLRPSGWSVLSYCGSKHTKLILRTAWILITNNADYLKVQGWKQAVGNESHRKDLVAGNLAEFAISGDYSNIQNTN